MSWPQRSAVWVRSRDSFLTPVTRAGATRRRSPCSGSATTRSGLAHTVRHLGDVHHDAGDAALAEACYVEALSLYRSHGQDRPLDHANAVRRTGRAQGRGLGERRGDTTVGGSPRGSTQPSTFNPVSPRVPRGSPFWRIVGVTPSAAGSG